MAERCRRERSLQYTSHLFGVPWEKASKAGNFRVKQANGLLAAVFGDHEWRPKAARAFQTQGQNAARAFQPEICVSEYFAVINCSGS